VSSDHAQSLARRALSLRADQRSAFLARECNGDSALRSAVDAALEALTAQTIDTDSPSSSWSRRAAESPDTPSLGAPSGAVGGYRIQRVLGEGGMGLVYLATQESTGQPVALKVIRPGVLSARMLERFAHEVRVLARLQHEGIARIFEAGTIELAPGAGPQPFFAMEVVEGSALTEHAADAGLDLRARLRLLAQVARIVHHAHARAVVHRDLKPANILVTADGRLKVLDFGVARVVEDDDASTVEHTQHGQVVGTLPYMSPEQVLGQTDRIDTRSDVYTLGVILFELLAGRLPHDVGGKSIVEAARTITEGPGVSRTLSRLPRTVPADVRTIIGKAMFREPDRRYQSAEELAADVERFLRFEPITARPPSAIYVASRFARRHRAATAAIVGIALAVGAGAVATGAQAVIATRQRDRAVEAERTSRAVNDLLVNMLVSADPEQSLGQDLTVREVLDRAAPTIDADPALAGRPLVRAPLHIAIGRTYQSLGVLDEAERQFRIGHELIEANEGPGTFAEIMARRHLAGIAVERGGAVENEPLVRRACEELKQLLGPDHPETLGCEIQLARAVYESGEIEKGIELIRDVADRCDAALGPDHVESLLARHNLASALRDQGQLDAALEALRAVLERRERVQGQDHPETLYSRNNLAAALALTGDKAEAERLFRETLEARERVLGPDHLSTATTGLNLANILVTDGRLAEAEPLVRRALRVYEAQLDEDHAKTITAVNVLAYLLEELGNLDEAEALYRRALASAERLKGVYQVETLAPLNNLAMLLSTKGDFEDAEQMFADLVNRATTIAGENHFYVGVFLSNRGLNQTRMGRNDDAAATLTRAVAILEAGLGPDHARSVAARQRLDAAQGAAPSAAD